MIKGIKKVVGVVFYLLFTVVSLLFLTVLGSGIYFEQKYEDPTERRINEIEWKLSIQNLVSEKFGVTLPLTQSIEDEEKEARAKFLSKYVRPTVRSNTTIEFTRIEKVSSDQYEFEFIFTSPPSTLAGDDEGEFGLIDSGQGYYNLSTGKGYCNFNVVE